MSHREVVIGGTLKPDGTLELDEKPNLSPSRVTVALRAVPELQPDDPFWRRMQAIWDAQNAAGHVPRGSEEIEAERRQMREEWDDHQQAIERLQEECRAARQSPEGP